MYLWRHLAKNLSLFVNFDTQTPHLVEFPDVVDVWLKVSCERAGVGVHGCIRTEGVQTSFLCRSDNGVTPRLLIPEGLSIKAEQIFRSPYFDNPEA